MPRARTRNRSADHAGGALQTARCRLPALPPPSDFSSAHRFERFALFLFAARRLAAGWT